MSRVLNILTVAIILSTAYHSQAADKPELAWQVVYTDAVASAKQSRTMLLIQFRVSTETERDRRVAARMTLELSAANRSERFVVARLPIDYEFDDQGTPTRLLSHAAFAEMHGQPGLTILDFTDPDSKTFHHVVSVYPLAGEEEIPAEQLRVFLDLPAGTLTQRTLIFAVRTHAESPASAAGEWHALLAEESASHARHQANLQLQGHHDWENRFHRISAKLPAGLLAQEVCAESWPGQELLAAARECVHSWRQSPGHWDAVKTRHDVFGYDLQRGANGVWYATGIFGRGSRHANSP